MTATEPARLIVRIEDGLFQGAEMSDDSPLPCVVEVRDYDPHAHHEDDEDQQDEHGPYWANIA